MSNQALKSFVRGAYDLQKMRMQLGNRICAEFRAQHGVTEGEKITAIDDDGKNTISIIMSSYKRLTDGLVNLPSPTKFKGDKVIATYTMLCLVDQYSQMESDEARHFRRLGNIWSGNGWCYFKRN